MKFTISVILASLQLARELALLAGVVIALVRQRKSSERKEKQ